MFFSSGIFCSLPMKTVRPRKFILSGLLSLFILSAGVLIRIPISSAASTTPPQISTTAPTSNTLDITLTFSQSVPQGNIIDIELYNSSHQKSFQAFSIAGGTTYSVTTTVLPAGTYTIEAGLFNSNWSSNYAWFSNLSTVTIFSACGPVVTQPSTSLTTSASPSNLTPTPVASNPAVMPTIVASTPTSSPQAVNINLSAYNAAQSAYSQWKSIYVRPVSSGMFRVVRPENNNDTVSEGIGYGMLLSAFAGDKSTFDGLWAYGQKYMDGKGLMNWDIDQNGNVIGQGSATDADEDMTYALIKANSKWPGNGYDNAARNLITHMKSTELINGNYLNPGDNWGQTDVINPSYLEPSYYRAFAQISGDSQWNSIANATSSWLNQAANSSTGLLPDWLNSNFSNANISFDQYTNDFYYDAVRTPIRLLLDYKSNGDPNAENVLQKQANFFSKVGMSNLKSGYTLSGQPLTSYLDTTFIAAYAAAGQVNPSSTYAQQSLTNLINNSPTGYYGTSLRAITLYIISGIAQ